jgi:16S rRNA (guanine1207-N2)-methyltransferase
VTADADDPNAAHYFAYEPSTDSAPVDIDVVLPDTAFTLRTDRGVFSRGRLDTGTSVLLRADQPLAPQGDLLDLGCGAGPIALAMARRAPEATVWAVDVNARARELTRANAERNGLTNVRVAAPDEVPDSVRFSAIWSNPPIRIGKIALRSLLTTWLDRLTPDSSAVLVVQRHLGADSLQRWLIGEGYATERVASKAGFRVLVIAGR